MGPGLKPFIIKAPSKTAVTVSPGIPRVRRGTKVPPIQALFDDSEATRPSIIPVPNFSGCLELFFGKAVGQHIAGYTPKTGKYADKGPYGRGSDKIPQLAGKFFYRKPGACFFYFRYFKSSLFFSSYIENFRKRKKPHQRGDLIETRVKPMKTKRISRKPVNGGCSHAGQKQADDAGN